MQLQTKSRTRFLTLSLILLLSVAASQLQLLPGYAAQAITIIINGLAVSADTSPLIESGRVLLPLRAVGEALGATVVWDDATRTITAYREDQTIIAQVGERQALVNGSTVDLEVPIQVSGGRTFVPVRFFSESLGATVTWDERNYLIRIVTAGGEGPGYQPEVITIVGSAAFTNQVTTALQLLAKQAPEHYREVTSYLQTISEGEHSGVDVYTQNFTIGGNTVSTADQFWLASIIVHDAHHSSMYAAGRVFSGEAAEAECIVRQKDALRQMGAPEYYQQHLDSVLATKYWEVPYDSRNW